MTINITRLALSVTAALLLSAVACSPATPVAPTATSVPATRVPTAVPPPPTETPKPAEPKIIATYTLPDLPLAKTQNAVLPGSIVNDRKLSVGGLSDLWRGAGDPLNQFWMVADRGPTGRVSAGGTETRRTFVIQEFDPLIFRVQAQGDTFDVLETIPIVTASGKPVMGLPNIEGYDEVVYDYLGQSKLPTNPNSMDPEGLVRGVAGDFWVADEYNPSLIHLDKTGKVLKRYIPQGLELTGTDYPVAPILPTVLKKRKSNRGFESLALSESEKTLYTVVQSPLRNPDKKTGDASRIVRLFAFDIASEKLVAEYAYRLDVSTEFDPKNQPPATEMSIAALVSIGPTTLLVEECTDVAAKLYLVDLSQATNILDTKWDDPATSPSLESLEDPSKSGIRVLPKSPVLDLTKLPGMPTNIVAVTVIDQNTIAIANDNEYEISGFDEVGNNVPQGIKSKIIVIRLAKPLQ